VPQPSPRRQGPDAGRIVYLVVGLGNPGPKYARNRHNVGFMVVEGLADRGGAGPSRDKFKGRFTKVPLAGQDAVLLEPLTYMNLSGESVAPALQFFKVPLDRLVVVHDELDLPFGTIRLKVGGGTAGHKGPRSIVQHCGGEGFVRLRMGIGRPPGGRSVESWVLSDFDASERAELPDLVQQAGDAVELVLSRGAQAAMNLLHAARP
jgi:peptidyl-tRNA hydrolase, PTH1 family